MLTVKFWVYIANCYDGSACVKFFNTEEEAEIAASKDNERFCEDVRPVTITIDPKTLQICQK